MASVSTAPRGGEGRRRLRALCGVFAVACLVLIAVNLSVVLVRWFDMQSAFALGGRPFELRIDAPPMPEVGGRPWTEVEQGRRLGGLALWLAYEGLLMWALWQASRCLRRLAKGDFFAGATTTALRNFVLGVLVYFLIGPLIEMGFDVICAVGVQGGSARLTIGMTTQGLMLTTCLGLLAVVSAVLNDAARIAEDNNGFV